MVSTRVGQTRFNRWSERMHAGGHVERNFAFDYIEMLYNPKCQYGFNNPLSPVELEHALPEVGECLENPGRLTGHAKSRFAF
jgi:hypothetical protein